MKAPAPGAAVMRVRFTRAEGVVLFTLLVYRRFGNSKTEAGKVEGAGLENAGPGGRTKR